LLCAGVVVGGQWKLEQVPPPRVDVNLFFVPPAGLTEGLAAGYQNMIADGLWLGLLQYYGDRLVHVNKHAVNLDAMFELITNLDPKFYFAYFLGTWALSDNHQPEAACALLNKGQRLNPTDYNYPYLRGFVQFLFQHDYAAAAKSFAETTRYPGAPRFAWTLQARMEQTEGKDDLALSIWRGLAERAPDENTRAIAKKNVERILAEISGQRPRAFKPLSKRGRT
jgi:hypothetical protein